jgi:hypothetical protein
MTKFQFQTPEHVADYMVSLITEEPKLVLEPSIGEGNLVKALWKRFPKARVVGFDVEETPLQDDRLEFFKMDFLDAKMDYLVKTIGYRFDLILANPPFTPMLLSYKFFDKLINIQKRGIYILPYLFLINSDGRARDYSLLVDVKNIFHLPRSTFKGSRIQSCILDVRDGITLNTNYVWYDKRLQRINR